MIGSELRGVRLAALAMTGIVLAACGSGKSIITAGNDTPAATPPVTSAAPAPTTTGPGEPAPPGTDPSGTAPPVTPPMTNATTTTTPLDALSACPVDALADVTEPVEITFWHGLNVDNEEALERAVEAYNDSQDRVRVRAENQGGYLETIDKYFQSSASDRPAVVMLPDYSVQRAVDSSTLVPVGACISAAGYDASVFHPATLAAYRTEGVQWGMPFNVSDPVLYYNKNMFEAAGLDPDRPPLTLDEVRQFSQAIVDSGAATYGIAVDSGADSGGGWYLEQWFANMGELYADNGNGRLAPAAQVLFDGPAGVELLSTLQALVDDGLAVYVGDNASGGDQLFKLADAAQPAAMAVGTSASLGTIMNALAGGLIPGLEPGDLGVGPLPGPNARPTALVGGAALYVADGKSDVEAAAAWDFIVYMSAAQTQSTFASETGYVPIRPDALELDPVRTVYIDDPRFRVAYDQLVTSTDSPAGLGAILGPQREIRTMLAAAVAEVFGGGDVQAALSEAAAQANELLAGYNASN